MFSDKKNNTEQRAAPTEFQQRRDETSRAGRNEEKSLTHIENYYLIINYIAFEIINSR